MSELSEGDAIASDRLEERGFQWLAKVIRGEIVAPEWMIEIMANGPSDQVQSWMITLRSVDQLRRYTAPNFFDYRAFLHLGDVRYHVKSFGLLGQERNDDQD